MPAVLRTPIDPSVLVRSLRNGFERLLGRQRTRLRGRTVDLSAPLDLRAGEILLSFDDGPSAKLTPRILRTLARFDVTALFFMVGRQAATRPATARNVRRKGHLVGSHTFNHPRLPDLSINDAMAEIETGHAAVAAALPAELPPAPLFRFPYLIDTPQLRQRVEAMGMRVIDVDIIAYDWEDRTVAATLAFVLGEIDRHGKGIVLLHDIQRRTAAMLPGLLWALRERGMTVITPTFGERR